MLKYERGRNNDRVVYKNLFLWQETNCRKSILMIHSSDIYAYDLVYLHMS